MKNIFNQRGILMQIILVSMLQNNATNKISLFRFLAKHS